LLKTLAGWRAVKPPRRIGLHLKGDVRMLGDRYLVELVLERRKQQKLK